MTTANKEATTATVASKRIGYAIQLQIIYLSIDSVTKRSVNVSICHWVQGASKSATKLAAKLEQARQLALPDTVDCYIVSGTFPVTNR